MPSVKDWNTYKTFVTCAILGLQNEADDMLRIASVRNRIIRIVDELRRTQPTPLNVIYRGLLLEPHEAAAGHIRGDHFPGQYISFSEDKELACWFARPDGWMSQTVKLQRPTVEGYLGDHRPKLAEILFHHGWLDYLHATPGVNVYEICQQLEQQLNQPSGSYVHQMYWHVKTQKEVTLIPAITIDITEVDAANCPPSKLLDKKFRLRPDFVIAPVGLEKLGVRQGEKLYLDSLEIFDPLKTCPMCGNAGIEHAYALKKANLIVYICNCGNKGFALQPAKPRRYLS